MWSFLNNMVGGGSQTKDRAETMQTAEEGAEFGKSLAETQPVETADDPAPQPLPEQAEEPVLHQGRGKFGNFAMSALMAYAMGQATGSGGAAGGSGGGGAAAGAGEAAAGAGEAAAGAGEAAAGAASGGAASGSLSSGAAGGGAGALTAASPGAMAGASGAAELASASGAGAMPTNAAAPVQGASGLYELQGAPAGPSAAPTGGFDWLEYVKEAAKQYGKNKIKQKTAKYANFEQVFGGGDSSGLYANW